ncbi:MAG: DMT family transporter [SAR324 cluster bacterium]|nr:DMT family transporter [SAR324 cluster bacterium]
MTLAPWIFVFLWSTGFIGAKYGLPWAEPFTFLFYRMLLSILLYFLLILIYKPAIPTNHRIIGHSVISGLLMHGAFLGGVFGSIKLGMSAGLGALIVGMQPLMTAVLAKPMLGDRVSRRQWFGLFLGMTGISIVLAERAATSVGDSLFNGFGLWSLTMALIALVGISIGNLWQKKYCAEVHPLSGAFIQYSACAILFGIAALNFETMEVVWNLSFLLAMGWLVFGLSLTAILLLMFLIKKGEATKTASLFFLVPPLTVLESYFLFDETLSFLAMLGVVVAVSGVMIVISNPSRSVFRRAGRGTPTR